MPAEEQDKFAPQDDLRNALESAITEHEQPEQVAPPASAEKSEIQVPTETASEPAAVAKDAAPAQTTPEPTVEPAPRSWKPALGEKWKTLDPEIRAEVLRREKDMTRAFGESGQARELAKGFSEVVRPFEARMRTLGVQPLQAMGALLKADHLLSTAPPTQRAQFMAKLIKDYGVDVRELDSALAGEAPPDPVGTRVEQLLEERLAPVRSFLAQQQQQAQQVQWQRNQEAALTVEAMQTDTAQFPHFETVREDMADIIEMSARRGSLLTPQEAYERACMMNAEVRGTLQARQTAAAQKAQAAASNSKTAKALSASASVNGAPAGSPSAASTSGSLRDTIEAAWSQVNGR